MVHRLRPEPGPIILVGDMKRSPVGFCTLLLFSVCSAPPSLEEPVLETALAVVEGVATAPDGVSIAFDSRGKGEVSLIFVHCWACDRSFWKEQLDVFSRYYRVVSLDLAGHGASGTDRQQWSIAGLAGDVQAVIEELELERCILIGHSLGGPVSLVAAAQMPHRIVGVIGVDTIHSVDFEFPSEAVENLVQGFESDFTGMMETAVAANFPENADKSVLEWVTVRASEANPEAVLAIVRDFPNFDPRAALSEVKVPVRCINAKPYSPSSFDTEIEANQNYADFDAVLMEGVGHYLMLEKPEEFNRLLGRTIERIVRGG